MEDRKWLLFCVFLTTYIYNVLAQCPGPLELTLSTVYEIHTLKYPSSGTYTENLDCTWKFISANAAAEDVLMFIQIHRTRANDILTISNGDDTPALFTSSSTGTSDQSLSLVALSGTGKINFVSDNTADSDQNGFTITYMSASANDGGGCSSPVSLVATDTTQYLTSPNFPSKYPTSSSCSWSIDAQDSCGTLILDFILIDLEPDCGADKIRVTYDGNNIDLCISTNWSSPLDYNTAGPNATIIFTADGSDEQQGFVLSYRRTGCTVTTAAPAQTDSKSNVGAIVGGSVGAVAGVGCMAGVTAWVLHSKGMIGSKGVNPGKGQLGKGPKGKPDNPVSAESDPITDIAPTDPSAAENGVAPVAAEM